MATFAPRLASQQIDRVARLQTMMDMPFTMTRNLGEQAQQGILDSFGLGTVIREGSIPAGNTVPTAQPRLFPNPVEPLGRLAQNIGGMIRRDREQPSLSEAEYKASPYFRSDIPFEQGMTEDRAAALAMFYDTKKVREYFGQKRPFSTFIGQFAGQALDPINYVPVFGQAAEAAAVARLGTIAGRAVLGSADAAINTAAFGLLSAGLRDEFGDDTSWQAMTSEIAMSALIGGAFGGVSGVISNAVAARRGRFDRQLEAAVADSLTDLRGLKESRAVLNEAVGDMAAGRDVNLSPNGQAAIERIQTQAMNTASTARALDEQTANIPDGARVAITPAGSRVEIRPEVVELDSLVNASGALQVRNRSSQASAAQVEQIATTLDPARLMTSVDADSGAPIVGGDNVVDSGNGRVMALRRAYEAYPERAGAYRKALETAGYDLTGIRNPVLISRRVTELSDDARAKFNEEANAPRAAQMSAVELAAMDRNALDGTLDVLDPSPITSAANRAFVQRFLGNLVPSARGALVDPSGAINADGVRRIENALVAQAYGDVDVGVLRRFAEATDDNTRSIVGAMSDVAGKWAAMRQAIKRGDISPEFDMTRELTDALRMIGQWREQAARESRPVSMVIREGMAQLDLLSGEVSPETQAIISAFYTSNSFARAAGRETITEFLSRIVDAAEELGRPQLFGEAGVGRMEVLRNAAVNEQGNLFTPVGTVDGIEADGGFSRGTEAAANREGAGSGDGQGRRVADTVSQRFAAAGRPEAEAQALGQIVDAFYAQQASRLGMTVDEFVDRFGIPEVRQGGTMPEAAMAQGPDSPAFREWFGDSKVVDANGEPLVVYKGSPTRADGPTRNYKGDILEDMPWRDIEAFESPGNPYAGFFSDDPSVASRFADVYARSLSDENPSAVFPVYIKMERPFVIDLAGQRAASVQFDSKADGWDSSVYRAALSDDNYDGVILLNTQDEGNVYIPKQPTQIKSQFNRGTFDPNDPRILYQPAYHGTPHLFDTFSTEKIGTGEGNQAYGYGLYFAGSRDVAEWYRSETSRQHSAISVDGEVMSVPVDQNKRLADRTASERAIIWARTALEQGETIASMAQRIRMAARTARIAPNDLTSFQKEGGWGNADVLDEAAAILDGWSGKTVKPAGRLFEVDVPDDADLLDWDAPLNQQPPKIQDAIAGLGLTMPPKVLPRIANAKIKSIMDAAMKQADGDPDQVAMIIDNDQGLYNRVRTLAAELSAKDADRVDDEGPGEWFAAETAEYLDAVRANVQFTGQEIYQALREKSARAARAAGMRPDAYASKVLADAGIPGHRYTGHESQSTNYVIYDDSRVQVRSFEQGGDNPRGAIQLGDTDIITLFETADASTALHETGHLFLSMLKGIGEVADAPADVRADWDAVRNWWGENADAVAADANASGRAADVTADDVRAALATGSSGDAAKDRAIDVGMQEQWARGFEAYVREGNAPTAGLARAFEQFRQWLQSIYRRAADLNVNLSPDIRRVFDNILAEPTPRADIKIDGMPVRVADPNAPAAVEPPTAQKSLLLNEPENAAARVGKDETLRDIALSHGVDPATGGFVEQGDIAQMREEGRLTADDEAILADADQMFADAEAYGRALDAAVACLV